MLRPPSSGPVAQWSSGPVPKGGLDPSTAPEKQPLIATKTVVTLFSAHFDKSKSASSPLDSRVTSHSIQWAWFWGTLQAATTSPKKISRQQHILCHYTRPLRREKIKKRVEARTSDDMLCVCVCACVHVFFKNSNNTYNVSIYIGTRQPMSC